VEAKLGIAIMAPAVISLRSLDRRLQIIEKRLVAFQDSTRKIEQLLSILKSIIKSLKATWDLIVRRPMG
jgi:hypothetical protein